MAGKKKQKVPTYAWYHPVGLYQKVRIHSFVYVPHRRYRWIIVGVAALIGVIIIVQLAYPYGRGLPFARIADTSVMLASHDDMAKVITEAFDRSKIKLTVGVDKAVEYPLKVAGAEPNTEEMVKQASEYPLWQRLLPGSLLLRPAVVTEAAVYYTNAPLEAFSKERSKELSFGPQNARLAIEAGAVVASEAVAGSEVKSDELLQAISQAHFRLGNTTTLAAPSKRTPAQLTSKDLAKVQAQAEAALGHNVAITLGSETFSPDKNELASWIVLATGETGQVTLSVDTAKVAAYLQAINEKVGTPAGQTNIQIVDGREVGRTTGTPGRALDVNVLAGTIAEALLKSPPHIALTPQFVDVQPSVIFNSKYTATQVGLQAYIDDVARSRNMHISIQQLTGERWHASARAAESIPSGSTYKLFVALVLFDKIDKGEIHWDDPMLDTNVAGCFERMTVASTNPCAEKWIAEFGRQYINDFIYARGFSGGTSFTTGWANQTTANDLTKFMLGLNDSSLLSGANRARLLDSLGRHPYQYGIPTGSAGVVHDKVGFLWDYVHDTAIVQHPRGTYIMTIMTKGQSYAAIASVTREIERIMYP